MKTFLDQLKTPQNEDFLLLLGTKSPSYFFLTSCSLLQSNKLLIVSEDPSNKPFTRSPSQKTQTIQNTLETHRNKSEIKIVKHSLAPNSFAEKLSSFRTTKKKTNSLPIDYHIPRLNFYVILS